MNKVILMGRLTRDPEIRYTTGGEPVAIARYSLAVNKRFKKGGEADADFIPCVAFGKSGEFAEKFFTKGQQVGVIGRLQTNKWTDKDGKNRASIEVIVEEQYFAESKNKGEKQQNENIPGFYPVEESIDDDDLPF